MSKHTVKAYVVYYQPEWADTPTILLSHYSLKGDGFAVVREQEFEIDISDDFDPTAILIADLEEKKRQLRAELAQKLANIDKQISNLQALPMPAEV